MAAGRAWANAALLWSALSFLPDADVIGFSFGVQYGDEWGHRGATHSLVFSLALGSAIGIAARYFRLPALRTGLTAVIVLTSHSLLDTLTNGGLGIALFWPFDQTRYFAPWTPIPVAPIGLNFFSPYGLFVAAWEVIIFAPVWWFALRRGPAPVRPLTARRAALLALWVVALWVFTSTDPLRERLVAAVLRDNTEYTSGFSEQKLGDIERGQSEREVRDRLGPPFYEFLMYEAAEGECAQIRIDQGVVGGGFPANACGSRGIVAKLSRERVVEILGAPDGNCWVYSRPPTGGFFRARGVCFDQGRVDQIVRRWIRD
jgi:inner membrane protein